MWILVSAFDTVGSTWSLCFLSDWYSAYLWHSYICIFLTGKLKCCLVVFRVAGRIWRCSRNKAKRSHRSCSTSSTVPGCGETHTHTHTHTHMLRPFTHWRGFSFIIVLKWEGIKIIQILLIATYKCVCVYDKRLLFLLAATFTNIFKYFSFHYYIISVLFSSLFEMMLLIMLLMPQDVNTQWESKQQLL